MPNQPPPSASLDRLRAEAKKLLRAVKAGELSALVRLQAVRPDLEKASLRLAHAQFVVAREHGFASWPRLKAHILAPLKRRRAFKRTPPKGYIEAVAAFQLELAMRGDPETYVFGPRPFPPLGARYTAAVRDLLLEQGQLAPVIEVLLKGTEHASPKVRYECAHGLDMVADQDARCVEALVRLMDDLVPRVRWMALHGLTCEGCKSGSLQCDLDVVGLVLARAGGETSPRVRRGFMAYLASSSDPRAQAALPLLAAAEPTEARLRRHLRPGRGT